MVRSCKDGDVYVASSGFDAVEEEMEEREKSPKRDSAFGELTFETR